MRGLKPLIEGTGQPEAVASFTDAWIETAYLPIVCGHLASHLLQMRGLKLNRIIPSGNCFTVASFTDAWIETDAKKLDPVQGAVASFTDAWIETYNGG